jgi:hypothetical protein
MATPGLWTNDAFPMPWWTTTKSRLDVLADEAGRDAGDRRGDGPTT